MRVAGPTRREDLLLVCEGIPDALTAAQAGYRAVAVLGAGLPDERLAAQVVARYPEGHLLVAFDADYRGRAGSERLTELLAERGAGDRVRTLTVPEAFGDLNGWAQTAGNHFSEELGAAIHQTAPTPALATVAVRNYDQEGPAVNPDDGRDASLHPTRHEAPANPATPALDDLLETLAYQHLLLDHQPAVTQNLQQVVAALETWRSGAAPLDLEADGRLTETLEQIGYHHLLGDDDSVRNVLGDVARAVDHWTDVVADRTREVPGGVGRDHFGWPGSLLSEPPAASLKGPDLGW
jgi:DNA primase (bacterial type)